jgi:PAS domain S-box-containing protein
MSWSRRPVDPVSAPFGDHELLVHIGEIHQEFLERPRGEFFESLLDRILLITNSEYGFLGEVLHDGDGAPYLKTYALTNLAWDDATLSLFREQAALGLEFHNLDTLFGRCLVTAEPVIANDAPRDDRRGGVPEGHPPLNAFLGIPLHHGDTFIGMLGIANRPEGYDEDLLERLVPLTNTLASVIRAHRAEQARAIAEAANARSTAVIEATSDFVGIADATAKVLYVNPAGLEMLGRDDLADIIGEPLSVSHPRWAAKKVLSEAVPYALEHGQWLGESGLLRADGTEIIVSQLIIAHRDANGDVEFFSTLARDITAQRELESMKDELIATVSHELRTPLAAITGALALVDDTAVLSEEEQELVDIAQANARRLQDLVDAILDVERLRSGAAAFDIVLLDVSTVAQSVIRELEPLAAAAGVGLDLEADEVIVRADEMRIVQVLSNLVVNAVEFSPAGSMIRVTVRAEGSDAVLSVADEGIGIDPSLHAEIFEPFRQADQSSTRRVGGSGLGLAIVRLAVAEHGGVVDLESTPGEGSVFTVRIPRADAG